MILSGSVGTKGGQSFSGEGQALLARNNQPGASTISANLLGDRLSLGYGDLLCDTLVAREAVGFGRGTLDSKAVSVYSSLTQVPTPH